ncbi:hypothetical protein QN395_21550 [Undibacterium sp. RTI2.2]|nr:hypothetical protein [Undibacterium sp. RTI2.2]
MTPLNDKLKAIIASFVNSPGVGVNSKAYRLLISAFNASDTLTAEFNELANKEQLNGFNLNASPGVGAHSILTSCAH